MMSVHRRGGSPRRGVRRPPHRRLRRAGRARARRSAPSGRRPSPGWRRDRIAALARRYATTRPAMILARRELDAQGRQRLAGARARSRACRRSRAPRRAGGRPRPAARRGQPRPGAVGHHRARAAAAGRVRPEPDAARHRGARRTAASASLLLFGTDMLSSYADAGRLATGLARTDLVVSHDLFLNDTARRFADVVLPGTSWLEELGCKSTNTHLYLMPKILEAPGEARPAVWILRGARAAARRRRLLSLGDRRGPARRDPRPSRDGSRHGGRPSRRGRHPRAADLARRASHPRLRDAFRQGRALLGARGRASGCRRCRSTSPRRPPPIRWRSARAAPSPSSTGSTITGARSRRSPASTPSRASGSRRRMPRRAVSSTARPIRVFNGRGEFARAGARDGARASRDRVDAGRLDRAQRRDLRRRRSFPTRRSTCSPSRPARRPSTPRWRSRPPRPAPPARERRARRSRAPRPGRSIAIAIRRSAAPRSPDGPRRSPKRTQASAAPVSGSSRDTIVAIVTGIVRSPRTRKHVARATEMPRPRWRRRIQATGGYVTTNPLTTRDRQEQERGDQEEDRERLRADGTGSRGAGRRSGTGCSSPRTRGRTRRRARRRVPCPRAGRIPPGARRPPTASARATSDARPEPLAQHRRGQERGADGHGAQGDQRDDGDARVGDAPRRRRPGRGPSSRPATAMSRGRGPRSGTAALPMDEGAHRRRAPAARSAARSSVTDSALVAATAKMPLVATPSEPNSSGGQRDEEESQPAGGRRPRVRRGDRGRALSERGRPRASRRPRGRGSPWRRGPGACTRTLPRWRRPAPRPPRCRSGRTPGGGGGGRTRTP